MLFHHSDFGWDLNFLDDDWYVELLKRECETTLDSLRSGKLAEMCNDIDIEAAFKKIDESEMSIHEPSYQNREIGLHLSKSKASVEHRNRRSIKIGIEKAEMGEGSQEDYHKEIEHLMRDHFVTMSIDEFKQASCNAVVQLASRILRLIELVSAAEAGRTPKSIDHLKQFDESLADGPMNIEKAAYLALLTSELDRTLSNLILASGDALAKRRYAEKEYSSRKRGELKSKRPHRFAKKVAYCYAKKAWQEDPTIRIKAMQRKVSIYLQRLPKENKKGKEYPVHKKQPGTTAVRDWIKGIAPSEMRKPGRPRNEED